MTKDNITIPEIVKLICQELDALYDKSIPPHERILYRQDILLAADERGINPASVSMSKVVQPECWHASLCAYAVPRFKHTHEGLTCRWISEHINSPRLFFNLR